MNDLRQSWEILHAVREVSPRGCRRLSEGRTGSLQWVDSTADMRAEVGIYRETVWSGQLTTSGSITWSTEEVNERPTYRGPCQWVPAILHIYGLGNSWRRE